MVLLSKQESYGFGYDVLKKLKCDLEESKVLRL